MSKAVLNSLKSWRIIVALLIGFSITGWMFYSSLTEVQFVETEAGKGEYEWVDGNGNGLKDIHLQEDFKLSPNGSYRLQNVVDTLNYISWSSTSLWWILMAILFTVGRDFFYMIRIRILTKNKLNWKAAFYVIMLWEFASALSPGIVGGSAVAMFILNRENIPFGKATAIVVITAFMDNLFYVLMIPIVLLFVRLDSLTMVDGSNSEFLTWWFYGGFLIIFLLCLLLYLTIFWYPKLAGKILFVLFKLPFLRRWQVIAKEWGKDIESASRQFKKEKRSYWFRVFFATFASWISRYLVINAILNAFLDLGWLENIRILGKQLIMWLFMLVSPTPGGSGIAEYAFSELLSDFSTSALLLAGLALLWRLISYFPYLFIGAFLLPAWLRRTK